jgi:hypothetical protein
MNFDINEVVAQMLSAIKGEVADNWDEVKSVANQFLQNRKDRFELLADLRLKGEISEEKFKSRLADEKLIVEAELHSIAIITKVIAQNAANAAIEIFQKAVKAALIAAV